MQRCFSLPAKFPVQTPEKCEQLCRRTRLVFISEFLACYLGVGEAVDKTLKRRDLADAGVLTRNVAWQWK